MKLISTFVFATRIVQSLYFLNPKFQASNHILWLYSPVCVRPGRKPRRQVFSRRGSYVVLSDHLINLIYYKLLGITDREMVNLIDAGILMCIDEVRKNSECHFSLFNLIECIESRFRNYSSVNVNFLKELCYCLCSSVVKSN